MCSCAFVLDTPRVKMAFILLKIQQSRVSYSSLLWLFQFGAPRLSLAQSLPSSVIFGFLCFMPLFNICPGHQSSAVTSLFDWESFPLCFCFSFNWKRCYIKVELSKHCALITYLTFVCGLSGIICIFKHQRT